MRNSFLLNLSFVLLLIFTACKETESPADQAQQQAAVVEEIKETWHDIIKVWEQGDATACAEFFTEDAIHMPSYNSTSNGRAELEAGMVDYFSSTKVLAVSQTTNEVFVHDSMAYEFGSLEQKFQRQEAEPVVTKLRYLSVFKKQPDGSWKLHRWLAQAQ